MATLIVAVALKDPESGVVFVLPQPSRHRDLIYKCARMGLDPLGFEQGFVTSAGDFVSRKEAVEVASHANQLDHLDCELEELQSQHLW